MCLSSWEPQLSLWRERICPLSRNPTRKPEYLTEVILQQTENAPEHKKQKLRTQKAKTYFYKLRDTKYKSINVHLLIPHHPHSKPCLSLMKNELIHQISCATGYLSTFFCRKFIFKPSWYLPFHGHAVNVYRWYKFKYLPQFTEASFDFLSFPQTATPPHPKKKEWWRSRKKDWTSRRQQNSKTIVSVLYSPLIILYYCMDGNYYLPQNIVSSWEEN